MGGFVENNEPLFFTTFICSGKSYQRLMEQKKYGGGGRAKFTSPSVMIIIIDNQSYPLAYSQ
jgi:hypothetical protein